LRILLVILTLGLITFTFRKLILFFAKNIKNIFYIDVSKDNNKAIVIERKNRIEVSLTGDYVYPTTMKHEIISLEQKKITIDNINDYDDGISIKNYDDDEKEEKDAVALFGILDKMKVDFYIGIKATKEDIEYVYKNFPLIINESDLKTHFSNQFAEAIKKTSKKYSNKEDLYKNKEEFQSLIKINIGNNINGFRIYDIVVY
jgi:uncharacterized membrane protein YqiK